jgi:peptidyl-prolyl cis-trans isomerase D
MMTLLRKHRQWLMIVIAILAIPFIFYFVQKPDYGSMHSDVFGKIYDRTITRMELQKNARMFELAKQLGMYELLQHLVMGAQNENEAITEFTTNRIVLAHEAENLGVRPTPTEITDLVRKIPVFQGEGGTFDLKKYTDFTQNLLPSLGFNEGQIEELAADELNLNRIQQLVASGVNVPESESRSNYQQAYGKVNAVVVRFHNQDFAKDVNLTDADIAKYFEVHKAEYKTDEKRKVQFVEFGLTDEQKKLKDKAHIDALQQLADRANDFTQALLEKGADFKQVAEKFKMPIKETGEFTTAAPDPLLKADPAVTQGAFQLTNEQPNSDALQGADGFFVLHLTGVTPSKPLSLEEAKPKIVEALKKERLSETLASKASEARRQIEEKIKSGVPAATAIQQANLKSEVIPPFSLMEEPEVVKPETKPDAKPDAKKEPKVETPDLQSIKNAASELNPGEVSQFVPTSDGGLIAVLEKREPIDEKQFGEKRKEFDDRMRNVMERVSFYEWLRARRNAANLQMATS